MHAFVDCDAFDLTANRGSIKNSDLEIIDKVKEKFAEVLSDKKLQDAISQRELWEDFEKTQRTLEQDAKELKQRFKACENRKYIVLLKDGGEVKIPEPTQTKNGGYSESETFMVLMRLLNCYPDLLPFDILDYNTTKGIDFVVESLGSPKYIELKGTFRKKVNHSFRNIYKFICYEVEMNKGDMAKDVEEFEAELKTNKDDHFESRDESLKGKKYTSYKLEPKSAILQSMEIIVLKSLLSEILGAKFQ